MSPNRSDNKAKRGWLIAFEGGETAGKTTQARLLANRIGAQLSFEPGGTELGSRIRSLLLATTSPQPTARAEALLIAADRAQHVAEVIRPAVDAGITVITDRYIGSSLTYQGIGRELGTQEVLAISHFATQGLQADLTILLQVDTQTARSRQAKPTDRIEAENAEFHQKVAQGYRTLAAQNPEHWVVINGMASIAEVAENVYKAVKERLNV